MAKGEKLAPLDMHGEGLTGDEKAVNIIKTTYIYCGRPTVGYQVIRAGLDVQFTPYLDTVRMLIDEYYNGHPSGPHSERQG